MLASFRSRLVLSNLLITLLGLVVIVFVFAQVLASRNETIKRTALAGESRLVGQQLENYFRQGGRPGKPLDDLVYSASRALQAGIVVKGLNGTVIVNSQGHTPFDLGDWTIDPTALARAKTVEKQQQSGKVLFQTPILGTRGHVVGAVALIAGVSDVRPGLFELGEVFLVVLGTAILVWLAIGLYFTFSISRPLLRVTAATRRMARGQYDTRVPAGGNGEIAQLAASFNVMASQVQRSNLVLKDFVANVSHDLRTPLTMITGFSQALLDGTARPSELAESAQVIHEEAVKMQHMVDDLLQLTRLESGLQTFRRHPVEIRQLMEQVVDRITRTHAGQPAPDHPATATIENRVPPGLPMVDIDVEQIERAVRNLVNNALQYTPATGQIRLHGAAIGQAWVEIAVSDTGMGIAPGDISRVFERFYRTDKSRERLHGHSGLGLAIVREIVEGHGGQIWVESELNSGTTFRFTVPQARKPGSAGTGSSRTGSSSDRTLQIRSSRAELAAPDHPVLK